MVQGSSRAEGFQPSNLNIFCRSPPPPHRPTSAGTIERGRGAARGGGGGEKTLDGGFWGFPEGAHSGIVHGRVERVGAVRRIVEPSRFGRAAAGVDLRGHFEGLMARQAAGFKREYADIKCAPG